MNKVKEIQKGNFTYVMEALFLGFHILFGWQLNNFNSKKKKKNEN